MNPVKPDVKDLEGVRSVLLQVRTALRSAVGGLDAILPMLTPNWSTEKEFRVIVTDLEAYERFIRDAYAATYEAR